MHATAILTWTRAAMLRMAYGSSVVITESLASCLINTQPLPAHSPAANNSLIACTSHDLTDDW